MVAPVRISISVKDVLSFALKILTADHCSYLIETIAKNLP
ncbi:MAG: hypothetical protein K0R59_1084 [Sphingobacterium sp.]|jgi:hypothetical protein|nr:hypothetical protein [Sphingobacterium sp.]